jgi:hypothetical protein
LVVELEREEVGGRPGRRAERRDRERVWDGRASLGYVRRKALRERCVGGHTVVKIHAQGMVWSWWC